MVQIQIIACKEILIGSNGERFGTNEVVIVDVTDKANPIEISTIAYPNVSIYTPRLVYRRSTLFYCW